MLLFLAILLRLPSFVGVLYLLVLRMRGKKALKVDEEAATPENGPMKVNRLKKGNRAPVQDNLYGIPESEEELIIDVTSIMQRTVLTVKTKSSSSIMVCLAYRSNQR